MCEYMAEQGSVWDNLAYRLLGDEGFVDALLAANPGLRHVVLFEAPTMINVPDISATSRAVRAQTSENLPPWAV